jgi:hypothetical protein
VGRVKDGLSVGRRARAQGGRGWASGDAERPGENERHDDVKRGLWSQAAFSEEGCEKTTKRAPSGRAAWIGKRGSGPSRRKRCRRLCNWRPPTPFSSATAPALFQFQTCAISYLRKVHSQIPQRRYMSLSCLLNRIIFEQYNCFMGNSARSLHVGFLNAITSRHSHARGAQLQWQPVLMRCAPSMVSESLLSIGCSVEGVHCASHSPLITFCLETPPFSRMYSALRQISMAYTNSVRLLASCGHCICADCPA